MDKNLLRNIVFFGVPSLFFFFIFLYFHYKNTFFKKYMNCYGELQCNRIYDYFQSFKMNFYAIFLLTILFIICVIIVSFIIGITDKIIDNYAHDNNLVLVSVPVFIVIVLLLFLKFLNLVFKWFAMLVASIKAGVFICKKKNILVIPSGSFHNDNKIGKECSGMEELKISEIYKITRKSGNILYVHGDFGSRKIGFDDKQYRDECIAMLEMATKKKLSRN